MLAFLIGVIGAGALIALLSRFARAFADPGWLLALALFFEAAGWLMKLAIGDATVIWVLVLLPLPLVLLSVASWPRVSVRCARELAPWIWATGFLALSLYWSPNYRYGLEKLLLVLLRGVVPAAFVFILYRIYSRLDSTKLLLGAFLYGASVLAFSEEIYSGRFALPGGNPIWAARTALIGASLAVWLPRVNFLMRLGVASLCLAAAWLGQSRGPLAAFAAANLAVALIYHGGGLLHRRRLVKYIWRIAAGVFIGAGFLLVVSLSGIDVGIGARFSSLRDTGTLASDVHVVARFVLYIQALQLFLENPILGVGLGGFAEPGTRTYPHNLVLELAAETGLVGLLLWGRLILAGLLAARADPFLMVLLVQTLLYASVSGGMASNYEWVFFAILALAVQRQPSRWGRAGSRSVRSAVLATRMFPPVRVLQQPT